MDKLVTISKAAELIGINEEEIMNLINHRRLRCVYVTRKMVSLASIRALFKGAPPKREKHRDLMTVAVAAERLSVSRSMVRKLIRMQKIATIRIGASVRIPEQEVATFRAAQAVSVGPGLGDA